jgi:hypothetical protein
MTKKTWVALAIAAAIVVGAAAASIATAGHRDLAGIYMPESVKTVELCLEAARSAWNCAVWPSGRCRAASAVLPHSHSRIPGLPRSGFPAARQCLSCQMSGLSVAVGWPRHG